MHIATTTLLTLPLLALAAPTQTALQPQKRADLTFTVTNFVATLSASSSSLRFTFADTREKYATSTTCTLTAATPQGLYLDLPTPCQDKKVQFKYTAEGRELVVQRKWSIGELYMTSFAQQGTWWTEGVNVTDTVDGKVFSRAETWTFPETSRSG